MLVDTAGKPSGKPGQVAANLLTVSKSPVTIKYIIAGSRRVGEFRKADKTVNRHAAFSLIKLVLLLLLLSWSSHGGQHCEHQHTGSRPALAC